MIRKARQNDLASLLVLENECFKEETFKKKQIKYLLQKAKSFVLVAEVNGNIIGSIIILMRKNIAHARIYSLNIHRKYRRKGIGGLLMDEAIRSLKEKGYTKVSLEVGIQNIAAQKLYNSRDFFEDKRLSKYYKNGDDAIHMIKIIKQGH
ncbi:MAG: GNAT family N-acetyltransferase [Candidatus Methanoperedens sp.]|nr:GNAT family N-acetyltransferase [Candidatus Methanoperedens sp.]MCE8425287.1 GNAT family N-acetyltransferase [Candidatus Methanoperedens sp.]MCE8427808.1 GNAT family N-acetyltransferase [Candidatus Methanoperedens sp.]